MCARPFFFGYHLHRIGLNPTISRLAAADGVSAGICLNFSEYREKDGTAAKHFLRTHRMKCSMQVMQNKMVTS
jgi:hypothetical protein